MSVDVAEVHFGGPEIPAHFWGLDPWGGRGLGLEEQLPDRLPRRVLCSHRSDPPRGLLFQDKAGRVNVGLCGALHLTTPHMTLPAFWAVYTRGRPTHGGPLGAHCCIWLCLKGWLKYCTTAPSGPGQSPCFWPLLLCVTIFSSQLSDLLPLLPSGAGLLHAMAWTCCSQFSVRFFFSECTVPVAFWHHSLLAVLSWRGT